MVQGQNEVYLTGYLRYPELRTTANGYDRFKGKVEVPVEITKKDTGEVITISKYVKVSAWNNVARELSSFADGTPIRVQGTFSETSYNGNCKQCGAEEKRYWTEVVLDAFELVEE